MSASAVEACGPSEGTSFAEAHAANVSAPSKGKTLRNWIKIGHPFVGEITPEGDVSEL